MEIYAKGMTTKEYMTNYRKNNIHKWLGERVCEVCGGTHTASNTSNHQKSNRHKLAELIMENKKLQEMLKEYVKNE